VQRAVDIPWGELAGIGTLGISAGASAPEVLVDEIIAALRERFEVTVEVVRTADERIAFNVPRELRDVMPARGAAR
jgi:4-hydroxy-3-methylbut-2-enyl diphosphate reductase